MRSHWILGLLLCATTCGAVQAAPPKVLHAELHENKLQIIEAERRYTGYSSKADGSGTQKIDKIFLGTSASYSPLREGDAVVDEKIEEQPNGLTIHVTVQRDGKRFTLDLQTPGNYRKYLTAESTAKSVNESPAKQPPSQAKLTVQIPEPAPLDGKVDNAVPIPTLQAATEKVFRGRDLVVLIDRSGSMSSSDCPGAISRWDWCKEQVLSLSEGTRSVFPTGFRLGLYNNHCDCSDNASVDSIVLAFTKTKPDGGTYTADAITHELREYRDRKRHGVTKPLVIVVVTDGAPNSPSALRDVLVNATTDMERADDLQVVFIQIGEDEQSTALLEQLDRHLIESGARFGIAHSVGFDKVKETGLLRAITDALANN